MTVARVTRIVATGIALIALWPAGSSASPIQESGFQDDDQLVFNTAAGTANALDQLRTLGVDRVRVSVYWATVAPDPHSRARPPFDSSDPGAYPPGAWDRYDQLVELARQRGIGVNLDVTPPGPLWAMGHPRFADLAHVYQPSAAEFRRFVTAVARRYSGSYVPPAQLPSAAEAPAPPDGPATPCGLIQVLFDNCPQPHPPPLVTPPGTPLPRVDYWSIWNEPNQPGWLDPQWVPGPRRGTWVESSPRIYRALVDAAWDALTATGHGGDTILFGETAPKGVNARGPTRAIKALRFLRQLYCLDDAYQPLRGVAATVRGCPANAAGTAAFAARHPGLFAATGYAHHPYQLTDPPDRRPPDPDYATIANLPRLSDALRRVLEAYHQSRPGSAAMPLYLTEFGYNTRPPNPAGVSLSQQSSYLDEAEFLAYSDPLVHSLTQFLLVDDPRAPGLNGVKHGYGATFQTGLEFLSGRAKPALVAYELPVFLPRSVVGRGASLRVWGRVRPAAAAATPARVAIQFRPAPSHHRHSRFRTLVVALASLGRGYLDTRVRLPHSGQLRLAWTAPDGLPVYSRVVDARVGAARSGGQ